MGPQPREGNDAQFRLAATRLAGQIEQAGWRRLVAIEPKAVAAAQGQQMADELPGVVFGAGALRCAAPGWRRYRSAWWW